jgi:hypothetical protein
MKLLEGSTKVVIFISDDLTCVDFDEHVKVFKGGNSVAKLKGHFSRRDDMEAV